MTNQIEGRDWTDLKDTELIRLYKEKHLDAAVEALIRRYQTRLFRIVLGIVNNESLAEELCQRAFVKAVTNLEKLRDDRAFFSWLVTIARSTTMDELRSRTRRNVLETELRRHKPTDKTRDTHEARLTVRTVLQQMQPDERIVVLLADLEEQSMREIAEILSISESAAKMRVKRARMRFRELLVEHS